MTSKYIVSNIRLEPSSPDSKIEAFGDKNFEFSKLDDYERGIHQGFYKDLSARVDLSKWALNFDCIPSPEYAKLLNAFDSELANQIADVLGWSESEMDIG